MSKEKKAMILWLIAGLIFLIVCMRDLYDPGSSNKSPILIMFEGMAGIASFVNALVYRRKYLSKKAA